MSALALVIFFVGLELPARSVDKYKWDDVKREGERLELSGAYPMAQKYYLHALSCARDLPPGSAAQIESLFHMANISLLQEKYIDAEPYYQRLITNLVKQKRDGTIGEDSLVWMEELASSYARCIHGACEEKALEHAVSIYDLVSGDKNSHIAAILRRLVELKLKDNRPRECETYARRLVRLTKTLSGPSEVIKGSDLFLLSLIQFRLGRYALAESNVRESLSIYERLDVPPGSYTVNCLIQLARILQCQKNFDRAERTIRKALKILERNNGKKSLETIPARELLAEIETRKCDYLEAIRQYETSISILESKYGELDSRLVGQLLRVRELHLKRGDLQKARQIKEKIASISKSSLSKTDTVGH
ncbi:MAG: tetratricopeptide repeat protein [Candidatus Obscuribacterales bacterium]|nr:tetratricopeptide repeat protein [Candidatus Obscuribacterales bacterium]